MLLREQEHLLEHVDHYGHQVALILVALSAGAELLQRVLPEEDAGMAQVEGVGHLLGETLHGVHLVALVVAVAYVGVRLFLKRNVGREVSRLMATPTSDELPSVLPQLKYRYDRVPLTPAQLQFVRDVHDPEADTLNTLNEEAFLRSSFEVGGETLRARNATWIAKHPSLFTLVRLPVGVPRPEGEALTTEPVFGYSAVVPLNAVGAAVYLRGLITDRELPVEMIAAPGEPSPALLIFAVALKDQYRRERSLASPYFTLLLQALAIHIDTLAPLHRGHPEGIRVWTQSEHKAMIDILRRQGFTGTTPPTMSAEGFELLYRQL